MIAARASRDRRLSAAFVALADSLVSDYDVVDLMQQLSATCVEVLGCDDAGLMLVDTDGQLRLLAASSELSRTLELFELQNEEGPCLTAFREGRAVSASLIADVQTWPTFGPAARRAGYTTAIALPLRLRDLRIGALNLFFRADNGMTPDDLAVAQALADVATIGILQERSRRATGVLTEQLQFALNNRVVIEQTKGVLAERGSITVDQAFEVLRDFSRHHRLSVSTVAHEISMGLRDPQTILATAQTTSPQPTGLPYETARRESTSKDMQ